MLSRCETHCLCCYGWKLTLKRIEILVLGFWRGCFGKRISKKIQSHLTSLKFLSCPWKKAAFQKEISFFYQWFLVISCQFSGGVRVYWTSRKNSKKGQMQYSNKERVFRKKLQRCATKWSNAKLIGEKAKVKVATLQWTKPRKWTLSRRMSYWKWGFSIAMLVYQRVIPPNGGTCFYKVRSKGLTKLQPWRVLRNAYHCMTLHVQAMHNSPTAFSNHRRSTWVSLMRPNRCSIWAPLLVQFLEREHTRYRKFPQVHLGHLFLCICRERHWALE